MSETRQQRRARQRREAKDATRPGPRPPAASGGTAAKRERIIDVELNRTLFDDDPADVYVSWHAEWGIRDDSTGTEDSSEDLAELVAAVLEDLRSMAEHNTVRVEWTIGGDPPEGSTIEAEIAALGVTLPNEVTA
ncbi:hypothetical protein [Amycolatopsis australiensis]|uniref:Uncharacterized protein n=1 Tax=Amycolatopsis australiensis TaxID=546364 RepID=A0A1K1LKT5_9PSEU|nr:hypothetical protein [Amycolatopsis australiensis]SFW11459.1 hypothetical protein SAMN04489730_0019 [Amycolatopsis australiensis]